MTILVYGEKANRTHENQMLQAFLERLEGRWAGSADWIVAVANAMWNGAEVDLVSHPPDAKPPNDSLTVAFHCSASPLGGKCDCPESEVQD